MQPTPKKTKLTRDRARKERRRLQAIPLFEAGTSQAEVARKLKVSRQAVTRWWRTWQAGGDLKGRRPPGRPPGLSDDKIGQLIEYLDTKPQMTPDELRQCIQEKFHVDYHVDHVFKIKRQLIERQRMRLRRNGEQS